MFLDVQGFQFRVSEFILVEKAILKEEEIYHAYVTYPLPSKYLSLEMRRQVAW